MNTSSSDCSQTPQKRLSKAIVIRISGYVIPAKKNYHYPRKNGSLGIDKEVKEKMERLERDLRSQLNSIILTNGGATWTVEQHRSWIASSLPLDDSWTVIQEIHCSGELVSSIEESGCVIEIEKL